MMKVLFLSLVDADISDEDWYYLELNEETGDWSILHEWHHLSIGTLQFNAGDKRYTFAEAKQTKPYLYENRGLTAHCFFRSPKAKSEITLISFTTIKYRSFRATDMGVPTIDLPPPFPTLGVCKRKARNTGTLQA